ncbi:MAG: ABC transporter ATP-binding protein [Chloroflexota bacterium]
MPLLEVHNMTHRFGGLRAVHQYNLAIEPGEVRGLIGPNGAGKTTIFNLITGVYHPTEGSIILEGEEISHLEPDKIADRGLGRTFQNLRLWRYLSVLDHVKMARYSKLTYGMAGAFFGTPKRISQEKATDKLGMELLDLVGIPHLAEEIVTNLPYGAQRRVELARALATEPKVLFLDEPTAGMNPEELIQMMDIVRRVHREIGMAIYLIEHRMKVVMELCEVIQTLNFGEVIAEGTPEEIRNDEKVIEAYLGKEVVF